MKYLLDFDRTIFDMDALYKEMDSKNPNVPYGTVQSLTNIDLSTFLFEDAKDFFLSHNKNDIEIISSGYGKTGQWDKEYQSIKVTRSGVSTYVNNIHIVETDKTALVKKLSNKTKVVFVDDHPKNITDIHAAVPKVQVIYLDRKGEYAVPDFVVPRITTLHDLDAIIDLL